MPEREEMDDRITRIPEHLIETILKVSRTSRQMLKEIGREPSAEELAEKLAMPFEKVRKVLLAKRPIRLQAPIFDDEGAADLVEAAVLGLGAASIYPGLTSRSPAHALRVVRITKRM